MLFKAGNQGNVSVLVDAGHWETEIVARADDREEKIKITHDGRNKMAA